LRFAHKTSKNRLQGDFLPCKLPKQPINRGFYGFFQRKNRKNLQAQQADSQEYSGPKRRLSSNRLWFVFYVAQHGNALSRTELPLFSSFP
jgi:hypothetical protein